jgi:pimeloyl-ACP methyl ester carboxylesterase
MGFGATARGTGPLGGLSPRRRALLVGLAAVLAVALVAVGVQFLPDGGSETAPPQDQPGPVLLVPGYGGGAGGLNELAATIRATGRKATVVQLPGGAVGDLRGQADALEAAVQRELRAGAPSVDVIGHSAGGVVARVWAQDHDGASKARRIITLGSPHHGAGIAGLGAALLPDACPAACQQLAPGSDLLKGLRTPVPTPPAWLALWTDQDETVTPPDSGRLEGAVSLAVQSVCPGAEVSHGGLPGDDIVGRIVLAAIGAAPLRTPAPTVCTG